MCCARAPMEAPGSRTATRPARVTHVEIRAQNYKGSLAGGVKTLFRFPGGDPPFSRLVVSRGADRRSQHRRNRDNASRTRFTPRPAAAWARRRSPRSNSSSPGWPGPRALSAAPTDANSAGDLYAARHERSPPKPASASSRLRPPIENGDWNDIIKQQAQQRNGS